MAEDIQISPDATHLMVTSVGPPSMGEMERTLSRLSELRREHGIDKIMVDSRARRGQPPVYDIYRGGELIAKTLGRDTRIAVLVEHIEGDHNMFEDVAINRGATIRFFSDEHLARNWLLGTGT